MDEVDFELDNCDFEVKKLSERASGELRAGVAVGSSGLSECESSSSNNNFLLSANVRLFARSPNWSASTVIEEIPFESPCSIETFSSQEDIVFKTLIVVM